LKKIIYGFKQAHETWFETNIDTYFQKIEGDKKTHRMGIPKFSKWTMMFYQAFATRY
jgi:hypothetical protein